ncbi:MAG: hypothetical protein ACQEQS_03730 [Thermodesulfobacteriota bacterium]
MSEKISGINDILAKTGNTAVNKKNDVSDKTSFSEILNKTVEGTKPSDKTANTTPVNNVYEPLFTNPVQDADFNKKASEYVEQNVETILNGLEAFSDLLGKKSVEPEDIRPLAGQIKTEADDMLRYSEKNNIPEELKSIVRQSSALAYSAMEKLNTYT